MNSQYILMFNQFNFKCLVIHPFFIIINRPWILRRTMWQSICFASFIIYWGRIFPNVFFRWYLLIKSMKKSFSKTIMIQYEMSSITVIIIRRISSLPAIQKLVTSEWLDHSFHVYRSVFHSRCPHPVHIPQGNHS